MSLKKTLTLVAAAVAALATAARAGPPPAKSPALVEKGRASYLANCSACHGDGGKGDGVASAALDPKPRDLVVGAYRNGVKVGQIYETLGKGIDGTTMVSFSHLPEEERWALAYYVLELRAKKK